MLSFHSGGAQFDAGSEFAHDPCVASHSVTLALDACEKPRLSIRSGESFTASSSASASRIPPRKVAIRANIFPQRRSRVSELYMDAVERKRTPASRAPRSLGALGSYSVVQNIAHDLGCGRVYYNNPARKCLEERSIVRNIRRNKN